MFRWAWFSLVYSRGLKHKNHETGEGERRKDRGVSRLVKERQRGWG